eukprot:361500-Chlamydomonas_euryale.AAC.6
MAIVHVAECRGLNGLQDRAGKNPDGAAHARAASSGRTLCATRRMCETGTHVRMCEPSTHTETMCEQRSARRRSQAHLCDLHCESWSATLVCSPTRSNPAVADRKHTPV